MCSSSLGKIFSPKESVLLVLIDSCRSCLGWSEVGFTHILRVIVLIYWKYFYSFIKVVFLIGE